MDRSSCSVQEDTPPGAYIQRAALRALFVSVLLLVLLVAYTQTCTKGRSQIRLFIGGKRGTHPDAASTVTVGEALRWAAASWPSGNATGTAQRPVVDGSEKLDLLNFLSRWNVSSLNPPGGVDAASSPLAYLELQSRLVVAIVMGVHSGSSSADNLQELHLMKTTLATLLPTLESAYVYRLYLGFDDVDKLYANESVRATISADVQAALEQEGKRRVHPQDYADVVPNPTTLLLSVHWVPRNYTGKPAWAQNDAALAAFKEGADYVLRTNDDTKLPTRSDWASALIADLRGRQPVPNLGMVGPHCPQGNTAILTHDFTHRTHVLVHGFYYPRSLPTWYADGWITEVYGGFDPPLMVRRMDVVVEHMLEGPRYAVNTPPNLTAILEHELAEGKLAIQRFIEQH